MEFLDFTVYVGFLTLVDYSFAMQLTVHFAGVVSNAEA